MHRRVRFPLGATALADLDAVPSHLAPLPRPAELERLTVLLAEVLTGARAPRQALDCTSERVFAALLRRRLSSGVRRFAPRLHSWRMQSVGAAAVEVTAVFCRQGRVHAMALRFEYQRSWVCTTLETTLTRK